MAQTDHWPQGVARVPAPWTAHGDAYVVITASRTRTNLDDAGILESLRPSYRNRLNVLMAVDYQASPVGPYLELLYIPGRFRVGTLPSSMSISRIYVNSAAAELNGIANWGLPKQSAEFSRQRDADGDSFRVGPGHGFASLSFKALGPTIPVNSSWFPAASRSFVQVRDGSAFLYTLSLKGDMQVARVRMHSFDTQMFPDMTKRRVIAAVKISNFTVEFSRATRSVVP